MENFDDIDSTLQTVLDWTSDGLRWKRPAPHHAQLVGGKSDGLRWKRPPHDPQLVGGVEVEMGECDFCGCMDGRQMMRWEMTTEVEGELEVCEYTNECEECGHGYFDQDCKCEMCEDRMKGIWIKGIFYVVQFIVFLYKLVSQDNQF